MVRIACFFFTFVFSFVFAASLQGAETPDHEIEHRYLSTNEREGERVTLLQTAWDRRYVSEGRDNENGESLFSVTAETEYKGFLFGTWIAETGSSRYEEQNYYALYHFNFPGLIASIGYNRLEFPTLGENDDEVSASVSLEELPFGILPALEWYYSFASRGSFYEASVSKAFQATDRFSLAPSIFFGLNDGYIGEGHNGANHLALRITAVYEINESISLEAYISQNFALNSDPARFPDDSTLNDFFYGGIALSVVF